MTRKISQQAANSFFAGKNFNSNNTEVNTYVGGLVELRLWGHTIALYNKYNNREIIFTLAGYNTTTIRERLRALGIDIRVKRGIAYYNDNEILNCQFYNSGIIA